MKITREQLRRCGACYTDKKIATLVPEEGLTPLEVAALDIPVEDRMWVLLREDVMPARDLRLLACDWAESACRKTGWNDERSIAAIAVGRRFAVGEATEAELAEARYAAWEARSAAWSDAGWPPRGAAAEATAEASSSAWASASSWAAKAAEWAARSAARSEKLADVVRVLRKSEGGTKA